MHAMPVPADQKCWSRLRCRVLQRVHRGLNLLARAFEVVSSLVVSHRRVTILLIPTAPASPAPQMQNATVGLLCRGPRRITGATAHLLISPTTSTVARAEPVRGLAIARFGMRVGLAKASTTPPATKAVCCALAELRAPCVASAMRDSYSAARRRSA